MTMKISISGFKYEVGKHPLPDYTQPFPIIVLMDFIPQYVAEAKRFKQWIDSNHQDSEGVAEHNEWLDEVESKLEAVRLMLKLDSDVPRNKDKVKKLYKEFQEKNPKG